MKANSESLNCHYFKGSEFKVKESHKDFDIFQNALNIYKMKNYFNNNKKAKSRIS